MSVKIYGMKESMKHGLKPYDCYDKNGNKIRVCYKNPSHHSSTFPLQNDPHIFRNLGIVIAEPDRRRRSTSTTAKAKEKQAEGEVIIYEKDNYYETINNPGCFTFPNRTMAVPVFYGYDGSNYTLSYIEIINEGDI